MTPEQIQEVAENVIALSVVFGPVVLACMEIVKLWVKKRKPRQLAAALLSVALPAAYLAITGAIPWAWSPVVMVIAWGISQGAHKLRNVNEATDADGGSAD